LRARDSGVFEELKCLFSTTPEVEKETKANVGHRGDRTLHRTRSRCDRTRPVSTTQQSGARVLGFATGASSHSQDRRVRSGTQRELQNARMIRRAARLITRDQTCPVIEGAYWTLTGCWYCRVRSLHGAHPVMSLRARCCAIGASGHCQEHVRSLLRGRAVLCDRRVRSFGRRVRS
jgi:hypothetical protein